MAWASNFDVLKKCLRSPPLPPLSPKLVPQTNSYQVIFFLNALTNTKQYVCGTILRQIAPPTGNPSVRHGPALHFKIVCIGDFFLFAQFARRLNGLWGLGLEGGGEMNSILADSCLSPHSPWNKSLNQYWNFCMLSVYSLIEIGFEQTTRFHCSIPTSLCSDPVTKYKQWMLPFDSF